ncbi:hypothetical protein [Sinimarinibacterium sp. NLF-5-8]|uniref:hypothetical protein n=1 Tax=Sinimarinibacterium sp. NLF-5-8 TaxID=2698684 RepID=UPI00137BF566|nr:hypothetical protein [Sinimarinibacterium sp. NLF-5-8]QHS11195.1 hypothetical protein GT972_14285 [Sinimarinibacterium sp. NLF-5-8]
MESSKRVVVVSLLGDVFHGIQIGTTVFGNNSYDVAVPEWNIDGVVEKTIIAQLGRTSARSVTVLQHDPGLRARMEKTWTAIGGYDYKDLLALARQQGADTLILVRPSRYDNAPAHKPGYGFFERNFMGLSRRCFYSLFITSAFSTASGKEMG